MTEFRAADLAATLTKEINDLTRGAVLGYLPGVGPAVMRLEHASPFDPFITLTVALPDQHGSFSVPLNIELPLEIVLQETS